MRDHPEREQEQQAGQEKKSLVSYHLTFINSHLPAVSYRAIGTFRLGVY